MATVIVAGLALAGLLLLARWIRQEQHPPTRLAALAGCGLGLLAGAGVALLTGKSVLDSLAIGLLGAAVLPLALLSQMRMIRGMIKR
ncbi:MAG: hypothetical protein HYX51_08270 [Chloroflexi bacterium]|nr:hypothetical protein [Chloroflexota bacterium]